MLNDYDRVVCWFSCGATSAVAAKLAFQKYGSQDFHIVYCDTGSEHPSNRQFLLDVQAWIGHPIEILKSETYSDIWDVFQKTRWLVGPQGARCTAELKRALRFAYQRPNDIQVFGYHAGTKREIERAVTFRQQNPEVTLVCPLIDRHMSDIDCKAILEAEGIALPAMYLPQKSGAPYNHNNCIGCVKGKKGYWNKIRIDYPEVFTRMALMEREIGASINRDDETGASIYLDELDPTAGDFGKEEPISCDLLCGIHLADIRANDLTKGETQ